MSDDKIFVSCPHCQTKNRVPVARLTQDPVCGKCGRPLLDGKTFELTDDNYETFTSRTELPVLIDFWAPWCGPCKAMGPQYEIAAGELKGRAMLAKVNSDDNPRLASKFGIRSIPTLVRLKNGAEVSRRSGAVASAQIVAFAV